MQVTESRLPACRRQSLWRRTAGRQASLANKIQPGPLPKILRRMGGRKNHPGDHQKSPCKINPGKRQPFLATPRFLPVHSNEILAA